MNRPISPPKSDRTSERTRPPGTLPKRVAFTDQEAAVIDFVESGICLGLARDGILDRVTRKRDYVIADKVVLTCDLSFPCLASRRHEDMIARTPFRRCRRCGI